VLDEMAEVMPTQEETSLEEAAARADDAPIVRLVTSLVQSAISCRASDIHIEPYEDVVRVRFRMDGLLVEQMTIPRSHHSAVVSRIKILSRMDIAERRRPQDGRFSARAMSGHEFDLRVSVMPQIHGEKVVIRLLEKNSSLARMDKLGLLPDQRPVFEEFLSRPYGMVLVTGPTGSGKSTTLYAALNLLNDASRNINTVEDPVEYHLKGVNQVQVDTRIGVTFASALRTFLRQDPDVILVGEIRDRDTAEMSVQAALTGHLVLSTLHTNDAPGAIVRMQNMGVEPFLISSAVIGVLAQRLLRTICPHCREWYEAPFEVARSLGLPLESGRPPQIARGRGCTRCGGRGMAGRTAVYEIMPMTDAIRDMTLQRRPDDALRRQALAEGMISMREAGIRKVLEGETTPEEVARILCVEAS
jgi:type IV pilus assembly protein PilB